MIIKSILKFLEAKSYKPNKSFAFLFWKYFFGYLLLASIMGLLALLGIRPFEYQEKFYIGYKGLAFALISVPFISIVITFASWIFFIFGHYTILLLISIAKLILQFMKK